jgi:hypothetical protein
MEAKKILMILAVLLVGTFAMASVVTFLSNTVNAQVTTSSPIELSEVATVNGVEMPLDAIALIGGDTVVITVTSNNLASVDTTGKYVLTATPALETTDVSVDGVNVTTGEINSVDLATTTITAGATETKVVSITVPASVTPGTYSLDIVYNVA